MADADNNIRIQYRTLKYCVLCVFLFVGAICPGQKNQRADSLLMLANSAKHDSIRINHLISYAKALHKTDIDGSIESLKRTQQVAQSVKDTQRLLRATHLLAHYLFDKSHYTDAIGHTSEIIRIATASRNQVMIANGHNLAGNIYQQLAQYDKAQDHLYAALKIREALGNKSMLANSYANIGNLHLREKDCKGSIGYLTKALEMFIACGDSVSAAKTYTSLGSAYVIMKDYDNAISNFTEAVNMAKRSREDLLSATIAVNLGTAYKNSGRKELAIALYKESMAIFTKLKYTTGLAVVNGELGEMFLERRDPATSLAYTEKAILLARECGNAESEATFMMNKFLALKMENRYREAFLVYEQALKLSDSIQNEETRKSMMRKEIQYEFEKRAMADSVKHTELQKVKDAQLQAQAAKLKQERTQFWFLVCGLSFVLLGLLFVVNRFRTTQKQKKIIETQKKEVDLAYGKLAEKNKEVMDSIRYAKRIQNALITTESSIHRSLTALRKKG